MAVRLPVVRTTTSRPLFSAGALVAALLLATAGSSLVRSVHTATIEPTVHSAGSGVVSAATLRFAPVRSAGRLMTVGGGLTTHYTHTGPVVRIAGSKVGFTFAGIGYGASLATPSATYPTTSHNQVSYRHAGVTEWYRNGALGLEQGFTLAHAPARHALGWLTVALRTTGSAPLSQHGSAISIGDVGRYGGLTARDASGRALPSKLVLHGTTLFLRVNDVGARYPLTIDPFVQQGTKLAAASSVGNAQIGMATAISHDGATAIVTGGFDNNSLGAAWVFVLAGGVWTQQAEIVGSAGAGNFGGTNQGSVALSGDGNTALIGARADGGSGAAYVYVRSAGVWTQEARLTGAGEIGGFAFGNSVALSEDGQTALVGGPQDNSGAGAVWTFSRSGSTWTAGQKLTQAGATRFGYALALSGADDAAGTADTALIAAGGGGAWMWTRSAGTWSQQGAELLPNDATGSNSTAIALSNDGNTALLTDQADASFTGAAWVFARSGSDWAQQDTKLTPSDETGAGQFGSSAAFSSDGQTALIGGSNDNAGVGAAWLFTTIGGGSWYQQGAKFGASDETGAGMFGSAVALSADATSVLVGGRGDNGGIGGGWAFSMTGPDPTTNVSAVAGDTEATISFTPPNEPIIFYLVTATSPDDANAVNLNWGSTSADPIIVGQLVNGDSYTFTVTAVNQAGTTDSTPSNTIVPVVPPTPSAPTGVVATAADGSATVSFNAAVGHTTAYTVTSSPGGLSSSGATSPITIYGLTDGTVYTFTVTATNVTSVGPASAASNAVTPTAPAAPAPPADPAPAPAPEPAPAPLPVDPTPDTAATSAAASGIVTSDDGTTLTWGSGTFVSPVTVSATTLPLASLPTTTLAGGTSAIELLVKDAAGNLVTSFSSPLDLVFSNVPTGALPAFSHDMGNHWTEIPRLSGTTLPPGYTDGSFVDAAGKLHVLTLHATAFGMLTAGSTLTPALQVQVGASSKLNLNYTHTLRVAVRTSLPGIANITVAAGGKRIVRVTRIVGVGTQMLSLVLPKSARHLGVATVTLSVTAGSDRASSAMQFTRIARR